ncbi:hypothetical protein [Nitrosomonas marina]|uniref:hypothetical protein n=1 Tax=Nitrosomonas marina TaxID=917 RepID=UPI00115FD1BF|nr:hypothetical protein [Nitrosomonas marina]
MIDSRMARAGLNWTVREPALKANVMPNTVINFEKDRGVNSSTIKALRLHFLRLALCDLIATTCIWVDKNSATDGMSD